MQIIKCKSFDLGLTEKAIKNKKLYINNIESFKDCKKAFYDMASDGRDIDVFIDSYAKKNVKQIKIINTLLVENEPILLCAVKNDLLKVKKQLEYHRNIGIKHFAYIDNMSTDGTYEWLVEQSDVSLFRVNEEYRTDKRCSWIRQATDLLGYDKWYLIIDSDEFFCYPGIENRNIKGYIDFLTENKIKSAFSLMVDMYSKDNLFGLSDSKKNIINKFCYFDINTYKTEKRPALRFTFGGPRMRLFLNKNEKYKFCLTKYPLLFLTKSMITGVHNNYPYNVNFDKKAPIGVLLHYKFIPSDIEKYKDIVKTQIYAGEGNEYKKYINAYNKNSALSFYYQGSQKLNSSMDLMKINILDKRFFFKFLNIK